MYATKREIDAVNASQKRLRKEIEELIDVAIANGVGRDTLSKHKNMEALGKEHYDLMNEAGMMSQLYYLRRTLGFKGTKNYLEHVGSKLDGFVRQFSSDPADVEREIGRENVSDDGVPWMPRR